MNDGTNNCGTDTDNGTSIVENVEVGGDVQTVPEDIDSSLDNTDSVSGAVGDVAESITDTEDNTEDIESGAVDNTENNVDIPQTTTESGTVSYIDYTSDLNHIDSLLYDVRTELQEVQSVSGNSIMVSLDDTSMQAITEVKENQDVIIEGQNVFCGLMGCLVLAVCAEWLIGSAKRTIKHFIGRKE